MALDERARRDLQRRLEEVLGDDHALTLMEHLPRDEPATKQDVRDLMDGLEERTDLKLEALTHRLLDTFRGELRSEVGSVRAEMRAGFDDTRKELVAQTRIFIFSMLTAVVTVGGLAVAAGRAG